MPSKTVGTAGAIYLALFFLYIPQNLSGSLVLSPFGFPSPALKVIFSILLWVFLIFFPRV